MSKKMAITVFTGAVDRLTGMAVLVGGAAASDIDVDIFLQLWGVYAMRKDVIEKNMEFSEHDDLKTEVVGGLTRIKAPSWIDMLREAKKAGNVKIHACSLALQIWNKSKEDLVDVVDDVMGAAEFLDLSAKANITYFI
ncbi:MAG: DsrE/DsrF/DrsH-like family protein [Thermoplasmata archaeon]